MARALVMWESLYASSWHHPGIAWAGGLVFALVLARRLPFLAGFLVLFTVEILADALCSAPFSPVPSSLGTAASVAFVILGDLRYFVLFEACASPSRCPSPAGALRALGLSFVVPLAATAVRLCAPAVEASSRAQFLVYEGLFLALALGLRFAVVPRRVPAGPARAWASALTLFEIAQYGLWVCADLLVLAGVQAGLGLRLVPNIMYYALFLPFVLLSAPPGERAWRARSGGSS